MQKGTILSVDDDNYLQTVISQYLEDDGYQVVAANDVASALEKSESLNFDAILLDLVLPDGEGISLIPQFRAKSDAVIIVVSGKSDITEKVVCLEMGADDYVTKPFELRELAARIKAALRRSLEGEDSKRQVSKAEKIMFRDWCIDRTQYQLFGKDKQSANLTTGEFKLLESLALSPRRALSREYLFDLTRQGGGFDIFDRAIDIQIARLRKKLGEDADVIKTVRGIGYMFCANVTVG